MIPIGSRSGHVLIKKTMSSSMDERESKSTDMRIE
jgi:hypothetical protein